MIKKRSFPPQIFFGWWTVLASGILNLWTGSFQLYGFSALFKPMVTELGFSRTAASVAASIGRLEGGMEGPLTGWITDRFGPKWIILFSIFLISVSLILMSFINSLWAFYLVWGVMLGTGANIIYSIPLDTAIANWFVKKRGVAMSIKWVLSGLSGVIGLMLVAWLLKTVGWRQTFLIGGVVMGAIGFPLAWFCVRPRRPEYYGLLPDGATVKEEPEDASQAIERGVKYAEEVGEVEFTLRQALKTPAYWLLIVAEGARGVAMPAFSIHGIAFLTDIGIEPMRAASMLALMLFVGLPMRFLGGFLADRLKKQHFRLLLGGAYLVQALGFTLFLLNQTVAMVYVWFIIFGIGNGAWYGLGTPMRARYFGRKAFGSISGVSRIFMTPVGMASPIYLGWVYDRTGSYITAFTVVTVLIVFGALVMFFARPPRPPAQITDIHKIA